MESTLNRPVNPRVPLVVGAVPALVGGLVTGVVALSSGGERVTQWAASGHPVSTMEVGPAWALSGGIGLGLAVAAVALAPSDVSPRRRLAAVSALFLALTMVGSSVLIETAHVAGVDDELPVLARVGLAVVAIGITALAATRSVGAVVRGAEWSVQEGTAMVNDTQYWTGQASSRFALPMAVGFVVAAFAQVLIWHSSFVFGALLFGAACVMAVYRIRATVDRAGLTLSYFPFLGWPRTRIRTSEIVSVRAGHVEPREHAGWGYRGSLRIYGKAALNLRRGPGLFLELTGGRKFVVTLDDAEAAAQALRSQLLVR